LRRDVLLIVNYPALESFRTMLENFVFQMVSVIRALAVSEFTFGISKRQDNNGALIVFDKHQVDAPAYGVLHYTGELDVADVKNLEQARLRLVFASRIGVNLATGISPSEITPIPNIMDGIMVFTAANIDDFEAFRASEKFSQIQQNTKRLYFGVYNRVL